MRIDSSHIITADPRVSSVDLRAHINTTTISNSATADFSVTEGGIYVTLRNVSAGTADSGFRLRVSTDGGSTYDSGNNYDSFLVALSSAAEATVANVSQAAVLFTQEATANAALGSNLHGFIWLRSPGGSTFPMFYWQFTLVDAGGTFRSTRGYGRYTSTARISNIRFLMETGNIATGEISTYRMF